MSTWVSILIAALLSATPHHAHTPKHHGHPKPSKTWTQPYGGCKEATLYPHSAGYRECKKHGLI